MANHPRAHPTPYWVLIGVGEEDRHCINAPICPLFQIPFVFPNETMSLRRNCVIAVPVPTFLPLCVHRCLAWPSRLIIRTMQRDNTEYPLRWPSDGEGFFFPDFSTYTFWRALFLSIPFIFLERFWQTFSFCFLFFFFFRLFGFGRVIDGILEFVYLRLGFDRLGNQDREIHVFVSLNYDGSGVYI